MSENPTSRKTRPRGYISNYQPQRKTLELLDQVKLVLDEYEAFWPLTIRQVFYRLVGRFEYPKDETAYERLCNHMNNARRARVIPFDAIRDDGVITLRQDHYRDADHFQRHLRKLASNYRRDALDLQRNHIEVWCEAAGMIHQLDRVGRDFSVQVYSSSGFDSTTARKDLADRICEIGKPAVVLHLGDYDPSGEAIFEALSEDVEAFVLADRPWNDVTVKMKRVALTSQQVVDYGLATAPPKASDSRSKGWSETCQLEALAPDQIADLLRDAIEAELDLQLHEGVLELERQERADLTRLLLPAPASKGAGL